MKNGASIIIEKRPGEVRAASLDSDGDVLEFRIEREFEPLMVGAVFAGRVRALRPEIGAAFVDIGAVQDGFLNLKKGSDLNEGDTVRVRVTRDAVGGKGPKLTLNVPDGLDVEDAPALLVPAPRLAERVVADWAGPETARILVDDAELYQRLSKLDDRVEMTKGGLAAFAAAGIDDVFAAALEPTIHLQGGGHLIIEETAAMTTVDVNAGQAMSGSQERQALESNLEAAEAVARALRLRNIGGLIAIDFLRMATPDNQRKVMAELKRALDEDPRNPKAAGFSTFGLVEVVREKSGSSLSVTCLTRAYAPTPETRAIDLLETLKRRRGTSAHVRVMPDVAAALKGPLAHAKSDVEARLGFDIRIEDVSHSSADGYEILED